MRDLTDIEFDHDAPSVKHRVLNGSVTHTQDGVVFSAGYEPLKFVKQQPIAPLLTRKKKKKAKREPEGSARDRAADKLAGFKEDEKPDIVKQALGEDASAKQAEDFVE